MLVGKLERLSRDSCDQKKNETTYREETHGALL
jgi:hypothetical protein